MYRCVIHVQVDCVWTLCVLQHLKCIIILTTLMINAFGPNKWMANVFSI